jgi:NtrC-family two-component system sensor histidine kinase KinB
MDTTNEKTGGLGLSGKLGLGFAALLAILIFLGAESIALLSDLGGSIEVILRENYRSVIACERMKEALERIDSATLFALGGEVERGRALAAENRPRFEEALQTELNNITLPGEGESAEQLRRHWAAYLPALNDYFTGERSTNDRRRIYFGQLLPRFQQIKATADQILLANQHSMEAADTRAKGLASDAARRMTLLLVLGTALAALSVYLLSRAVLRPLGDLSRAAREIGRGNLDASVPVRSGDEMGVLAATFNSMAGSLRELRRSDQALLLRARKVSQAAVDQLPEAVAVFSDRGEVGLVNATAASVLGLRPGEPVPADHVGWLPLLVAQNLTDPPKYQEIHRLELDGQERFYLPRVVPLRDDGRLLGTLLVLEDVTERRHSAVVTSDLLATASHGLRTPLASLQSCLRVVEGAVLEPRRKEALESAVREAESLARAVDDLDRVSRLEERREQLRIQSAAPQDLIEAADGEFRSSYDRHGVKLAAEAAPDVPRVLADPARIKLVLDFLLDNALANTPPGGTVKVQAQADGDRVRFAVTDTGRGIPEKHQERIFERFYQVPGSEDRGRAGLGLSIARDIVQSHGGEIRLESREGQGATVWFTLPAAREAAA